MILSLYAIYNLTLSDNVFFRDRGDHFEVVGLKNSGQDLVKRICKIRRMLLLSSGKICTLSMSSGALINQPKQKRGRAIALPAPPPPRSLFLPPARFE